MNPGQTPTWLPAVCLGAHEPLCLEGLGAGSNTWIGSTVEEGHAGDLRGPGGLALEDPNDRLQGSRKENRLGERLGHSDDLEPVLEGGRGSEGNQIVLNANKSKHLLRDEL